VELWFEAKTDPFDPGNTTAPEQFIGELAKILPVSPLFARTVLIAFDWRLLDIGKAIMKDVRTGFLTVDFSWLPKYASANKDGCLFLSGSKITHDRLWPFALIAF